MDGPETGPLSIARAMTAAINAHDVDGALAYFAEDAVLHVPGQQPNTYVGKAQIRVWLQDDVDHNISVETEAVQVAGETVTGTARVANDALREGGVRHVTGALELVVQRGKISSFTFAPDREP